MNETTASTSSTGASAAPGREHQGEPAPDSLCVGVAGPSAVAGASDRSTNSHAWCPTQFKAEEPASRNDRCEAPVGDAESGKSRKPAREKKPIREYTRGEEIFNAVSHGIGVLLAIAAIPITVVMSVKHGGGILLAASLIYTISMVLEYTASTLYHALTAERAKRVFKVIDHSAIYLFIAGSYTPYCLVTLADDGGTMLCVGIWALALLGVAIEAFWTYRPRWISAVIYLLLGWCVVWFLPPLVANLATPGLVLLAVGGVCYSVGCIFYVMKKVPYMHSVFHLWVLAGSVLQFLSIVLYVL